MSVILLFQMMVETTTVDERVYGGNKSAEGGDEAEATEDSTQQGCNIVITNRLQSTLYTKKSYQKHLKVQCTCIMYIYLHIVNAFTMWSLVYTMCIRHIQYQSKKS